jgi:xanthine dehydrogenase accessory factor
MGAGSMNEPLIIIKGAGDLATGVAHRLFRCGYAILMLEIKQPTVIRRTVSFAEAIYEGRHTVEGVEAVAARTMDEVAEILAAKKVAVLVDPDWQAVGRFKPVVVVDAILAKKNLGTSLHDAPVTIGLGPGFTAGKDVRAVIETQRGHSLGKVIDQGTAAANTGEPGDIGGFRTERLLRAPVDGNFCPLRKIGDLVRQGETVARVNEQDIPAPIAGVLRGILKQGIYVTVGFKVGDIDPRAVQEYCFTISDKARSVAGGVLEAVLHYTRELNYG